MLVKVIKYNEVEDYHHCQDLSDGKEYRISFAPNAFWIPDFNDPEELVGKEIYISWLIPYNYIAVKAEIKELEKKE